MDLHKFKMAQMWIKNGITTGTEAPAFPCTTLIYSYLLLIAAVTKGVQPKRMKVQEGSYWHNCQWGQQSLAIILEKQDRVDSDNYICDGNGSKVE